MKHQTECNIKDIACYTCYYTSQPIQVDGKLNESVWEKAPRAHRLVDIVTGQPGFFDTRVAALWDENYLYLAYWL